MKILFICILLTGCGAMSRSCTGITGSLTYKCSKNGVEYVQSDSGLAISLDRDGAPIICDNDE